MKTFIQYCDLIQKNNILNETDDITIDKGPAPTSDLANAEDGTMQRDDMKSGKEKDILQDALNQIMNIVKTALRSSDRLERDGENGQDPRRDGEEKPTVNLPSPDSAGDQMANQAEV